MVSVSGEGIQIDVDKVLEDLSRELFDLDLASKEILRSIADEGAVNPKPLSDRLTSVTSSTIRRRLGLELAPKSPEDPPESPKYLPGLPEDDFLKIAGYTMFVKTKELPQVRYGLSFKGFLASLASCRMQYIYLINDYVEKLKFLKKSEHKLVFKQYIKSEIAVWFRTCKENGLDLTNMRDMERFYHRTKEVEKHFGSRYELPQDIAETYKRIDPKEMHTDYIRGYSHTWRELIKLKLEKKALTEDLPPEISPHLDLWYHIMLDQSDKDDTGTWLER